MYKAKFVSWYDLVYYLDPFGHARVEAPHPVLGVALFKYVRKAKINHIEALNYENCRQVPRFFLFDFLVYMEGFQKAPTAPWHLSAVWSKLA